MVIGTTSVCRIKTQTKASYSVFFALAFQTESGASGTQATLDKSGLTVHHVVVHNGEYHTSFSSIKS